MNDFNEIKTKMKSDDFLSFKFIYDVLGDNRSKNIFYYRILYDLDSNNYNKLMLIKSVYDYNSIYNKSDLMYKCIIDFLLKDDNYKKDIYIYGYIKPIVSFLSNYNIRKIYPQSIIKIFFSNLCFKEKVVLIYEKIRYLKDYKLYKTNYKNDKYINIVLDNRKINDLNTLYALNCEFTYNEYTRGIQYFGEDFIKLTDNEIFVDAGAYKLETSKVFAYITNYKYKKIYAFEPDNKIYSKIKNNLDNLELYNKGLYSKNIKKKFSLRSKGDSRISDDGTVYVDLITLDSLNIKPTIIKLDIEGAELEAIEGMKLTIKKYKPKLLISGYHNKLDIISIINKVMKINNDYKIYIRHYNYNECETVIYFI